ncbi:MAG TPA: divalent metal cation transporter, partial [Rhizomicrobium sp.]|nr:divalent metal cation transporter [Rhizomicrobium sp.]
SSEEVEELQHHPDERPLTEDPAQAPRAFARMRFDTVAGMAVSNLVGLAIMISTAASLHKSGVTDIRTAADAARALEPLAGKFAFVLFSLGIVGTGMLALPVLAGSAAYAVSEAEGWKTGLDNKPWQAVGFYSVIGAAVALGLAIDYSGLDPIRALYWSAVVNGVIAVPMMAAMMIVARNRRKMGEFVAGPLLATLGWASTLVMAAAAAVMAAVEFLS